MLEQVISLLAALVVEILHPRSPISAFKTIKFFAAYCLVRLLVSVLQQAVQ